MSVIFSYCEGLKISDVNLVLNFFYCIRARWKATGLLSEGASEASEIYAYICFIANSLKLETCLSN